MRFCQMFPKARLMKENNEQLLKGLDSTSTSEKNINESIQKFTLMGKMLLRNVHFFLNFIYMRV